MQGETHAHSTCPNTTSTKPPTSHINHDDRKIENEKEKTGEIEKNKKDLKQGLCQLHLCP
jgi:hypothetical protein